MFHYFYSGVSGGSETTTAGKILWNDKPLTRRYLYDDPVTTNGGTEWKNNRCQYSRTIPDFLKREFPMLGTRDISTSSENRLTLSQATLVYMVIRAVGHKKADKKGWADTGYSGKFLSCYQWHIYVKLFKTGSHTIDNTNAMFLFSKSGIV